MRQRKRVAVFHKYFLYAELDKERFQAVYPKIRESVRRENSKNLNAFSLIACVLLLAMLLLTTVTDPFDGFIPLYAATFAFSLMVWVLNRFVVPSFPGMILPLVYVFTFVAFLFAAILGTYYSPDELAATFFVLLIAAPLVFAERPHRFIWLIIASYLIFAVMAVCFKEPESLTTDLTNATLFTVFALTSCVYSMNMRLQRSILEYENRVASETDALTGLHNRMSFENAIRMFDTPERLCETYFVYMDANGLHEINNTKGHAAGDAMLCTVADAFRKYFGVETYRIGGDEFVAFSTQFPMQDVKTRVDAMIAEIEAAGYHASVGTAHGSACGSFKELISAAETGMYASKAAFYESMGIDRRKQR